MEGKGDEYLLLSWRLAKARFARPSPRPAIVYMGASQATRSLVTRDARELSHEISAAAGIPVDFFPASSNNQRFEEALVITGQLPSSFRGVIVLMVNDYKNDYRTRQADELARLRTRIAVASAPSIEPIWAASGYRPLRTGVFFIDHLGFFAARRNAAMRLTRVKGDPGRKARSTRGSSRRRESRSSRKQRGAGSRKAARAPPAARQEAQAHLLGRSRKVLVRLLTNMDRRGVPVVLLENPDLPSRSRGLRAAHPALPRRDRNRGRAVRCALLGLQPRARPP